MSDETNTMKMFLQKQPYDITMSRHNLSISEQRILTVLLKNLGPLMTRDFDRQKIFEDMTITIPAKELIREQGFKSLRPALKGLLSKIVYIHRLTSDGREEETGTTFIQKYKYILGSSFVTLQICGELLPQLLDLGRGYTRYSLEVAFNTSSINVFRLYQYIAHYRDKAQIQCNIDTLRTWLKLNGKYKMPRSIKRDILSPAMRELKVIGDVWFDIAERVMDGRRLIGWKFNVYTKEEETRPIPKKTLDKAQILADTESEKLFERLTKKHDLSEPQALTAMHKIPKKGLYKSLYNIYNDYLSGKIRNIGAQTVTVLQNAYHVSLSGKRRKK